MTLGQPHCFWACEQSLDACLPGGRDDQRTRRAICCAALAAGAARDQDACPPARALACSPAGPAVPAARRVISDEVRADAVAVNSLPEEWRRFQSKCARGRRKSRLGSGASSPMGGPSPPASPASASATLEEACADYLERVLRV
ncbi:hypothetical protein Rsub_09464 [Raphidocelis subcapitata]|uniref:Uncharacterized protein n=1 Tax=Raphidocelis subcapitata TaxID=307507 RepID=A0A2V0PCP8_9CHLO|nr:hypothetical protein Rsub_09464 [Raphidocelis subcapitata]|eukprot:GBF96722.1 hypothetical protein Rsub_09464 [Raphidocelis subcapitata]